MMTEYIRQKRDELMRILADTARQLEQVRGAIALCDQLIAEAEGNGDDIPTSSPNEREDGKPVG